MLSNTRLAAMEKTAQYYISLYGDDPATKVTREHFAMKDNTLPDLQARKDLAKFFFWTAWTASAERPNTHASYTNNWPHEPLINNVPTQKRDFGLLRVWYSSLQVLVLLYGFGHSKNVKMKKNRQCLSSIHSRNYNLLLLNVR